jgi:cytochrome c-type biogenesis protein CcmH
MSIRRVVRSGATLLLAAVVLFGMISGSNASRDRVRSITSRLRCPVCQGESVADSPSDVSRQIVAEVQDQISQGWTDAQIEQFYIARYGSDELLDPPPSGRNLVLWVVPAAIFAAGVVLVQRKVTSPQRRRLRVGSVVAVAVLAGAALIVFRGRGSPGPGEATPPPTTLPDGDGVGRDLATVTNEEMESVIAKNPTVVGMRLKLIQRYLDDGEIDKAVRHSSIAVEMQSTPGQYEKALQLHGWATFRHGQPATAAKYLQASLALAPDDMDSLWYLGQVELKGLHDPLVAEAVLLRLIHEPMDNGRRTDVLSYINLARQVAGLPPTDMATATATTQLTAATTVPGGQ